MALSFANDIVPMLHPLFVLSGRACMNGNNNFYPAHPPVAPGDPSAGTPIYVHSIPPRTVPPPIAPPGGTGYIGEAYAGGAFDLWDYPSVVARADRILLEMATGNMPPPTLALPAFGLSEIRLFAKWIDDGMQP